MLGRLRNAVHIQYQEFTKSKLYQNLKKVRSLRKAKHLAMSIIGKFTPYNYQLHGDPIGQKVFVLLGKEFKATSFIETGTFKGYSTSFMAKNFPSTKILTCEINDTSFKKARANLKNYKNVEVFHSTSPKFLSKILDQKEIIGTLPIFYLDAHWLDNWPLEEELRLISKKVKSAIIIIDDFKVPDSPQFEFDKYKSVECSIDLVKPNLSRKNKYRLLLPKYGYEVFDKNKAHPVLSGYSILFQNLDKEFKEIKNLEFIKKYFADASPLVKSKR